MAHFSRCLTEHCCQRHEDRRSEVAEVQNPKANQRRGAMTLFGQHEARSKVTQTRAYDMYIRSNYSSDLDGDSVFQKRKALDLKWKSLSSQDKSAYQHAADAENARVADQVGESFPEFLARGERESAIVQHKSDKFMRERYRAVQVTLDAMVNHKVFSSGSGIHDFGNGIRA